MNWRDIGPVSPAVWAATLNNTPLFPLQAALYTTVRPHSALCLAQMEWESGFGTSDLAKRANNVLGQRPRPDDEGPATSDPFRIFADPVDCAGYWFGKITDPTYAYAETVTLEDYIHTYSPDSDNHPGQEAEYVAHIRARLDGWGLSDQGGTTDVSTYSTQVPGVPGGPLKTTYPIRFNLTAVDGFQRTGQKARTPRRSIQHGTDNPNNQSAWQEAQYFVNGAEGRQASVHSFADDNEVVIGVPLDEVAWQAADGGGPGNMNGFACEMMEATAIWNNTARRNRLIAIAADFMGRVSARFGVTKPERHWDFNAGSADRHHCPNLLMNTGLWDSMYVPMWQAARVDELKRMNGETEPTPLPQYATPDTSWMTGKNTTLKLKVNGRDRKIPVFAVECEYEATKPTWRYQGPDTKGAKVGDMLKVGETFAGAYVAQVSPSSWRVITPAGSWILMNWLTPKVTVKAA